jgi:hypothetical protein
MDACGSVLAGVIADRPCQRQTGTDYTGEAIGGVEVSGIIFDQEQNAWLVPHAAFIIFFVPAAR